MGSKPKLRADVEIRRLDERETLLYDPQSDAVHVLNSTAALIASLCDGEHRPEEMAAEIRGQFEVDEMARVLSDVMTTLTTLQAEGLLEDQEA